MQPYVSRYCLESGNNFSEPFTLLEMFMAYIKLCFRAPGIYHVKLEITAWLGEKVYVRIHLQNGFMVVKSLDFIAATLGLKEPESFISPLL